MLLLNSNMTHCEFFYETKQTKKQNQNLLKFIDFGFEQLIMYHRFV